MMYFLTLFLEIFECIVLFVFAIDFILISLSDATTKTTHENKTVEY